jgi:hypothetical protein
MRKFVQQSMRIIFLVAALCLLGWHRSIVDKTDFVHGFDRISAVLVTEGWKFLTIFWRVRNRQLTDKNRYSNDKAKAIIKA